VPEPHDETDDEPVDVVLVAVMLENRAEIARVVAVTVSFTSSCVAGFAVPMPTRWLVVSM
jgi:hypothetical protein